MYCFQAPSAKANRRSLRQSADFSSANVVIVIGYITKGSIRNKELRVRHVCTYVACTQHHGVVKYFS